MDTTTKRAIVSAAIVLLLASGLKMQEAVDLVMGNGAYNQIVSDIYARSAKKRRNHKINN